MFKSVRLLASLASNAILAGSLQMCNADEWGTLIGRFEHEIVGRRAEEHDVSKAQRRPSDGVVVYLVSSGVDVHPDMRPRTSITSVVVTLSDGGFDPQFALLVTGEFLELRVSDESVESVALPSMCDSTGTFLRPPFDGFGNDSSTFRPLGRSERLEMKRSTDLPWPLASNVDAAKRGWFLVRKDHYAAVSDATGQFRIDNLPAGELEFRVWHEQTGYCVRGTNPKERVLRVVIEPGKVTDLGTIEVVLKQDRKQSSRKKGDKSEKKDKGISRIKGVLFGDLASAVRESSPSILAARGSVTWVPAGWVECFAPHCEGSAIQAPRRLW